jgi:hypothetical protein
LAGHIYACLGWSTVPEIPATAKYIRNLAKETIWVILQYSKTFQQHCAATPQHSTTFGNIARPSSNIAKPPSNIAQPFSNIANPSGNIAQAPRNTAKLSGNIPQPSRNIAASLRNISKRAKKDERTLPRPAAAPRWDTHSTGNKAD